MGCGSSYRDLLRRQLQRLHQEDPEVLHVKGSLAKALESRGDLSSARSFLGGTRGQLPLKYCGLFDLFPPGFVT